MFMVSLGNGVNIGGFLVLSTLPLIHFYQMICKSIFNRFRCTIIYSVCTKRKTHGYRDMCISIRIFCMYSMCCMSYTACELNMDTDSNRIYNLVNSYSTISISFRIEEKIKIAVIRMRIAIFIT